MTTAERSERFTYEGRRLAYRVYGDGPRVTVLLHGLLLSQRMHVRLARALAERGDRVVTLDLYGHGRSDRPPDMWRYGMGLFARDVIALLDHLELDEAVVGGTSLGANTTLEVASAAPERLRGMVLEMPVLDNALLACAVAFTPLMVAPDRRRAADERTARVTRMIPESRVPWAANVLLDTVRQAPGPSAAVLQGIFAGRAAPHRSERRTFTAPSLVSGTTATPSTRSPTRACSQRSCPTRGCSRRARSWSSGWRRSDSPTRSPSSSTTAGAHAAPSARHTAPHGAEAALRVAATFPHPVSSRQQEKERRRQERGSSARRPSADSAASKKRLQLVGGVVLGLAAIAAVVVGARRRPRRRRRRRRPTATARPTPPPR